MEKLLLLQREMLANPNGTSISATQEQERKLSELFEVEEAFFKQKS